MSFIKKYAWYGSAVAASALLAVALLLAGPAHKASAAAIVTITAAGINNHLVGTSAVNGVFVTYTSVSALADGGGDIIRVTLPTGTTINASNLDRATEITIDDSDVGTTATAPTALTVSGTTLIMTVDAASTTTPAIGDVIRITLANLEGNEIILPKTATTTASVQVEQDNAGNGTIDDTGTVSTFTLIGVTLTVGAAVPADGISTVLVSLGTSADATTDAGTITVSTNLSTFIQGDDASATSDVIAASTQWSPNPLTSNTASPFVALQATTDASDPDDTLTLRAPTTIGTATIRVFITPVGGGAAQEVSQGSVTFTTPPASPGPIASGVAGPTGSLSIAATGGTQALTVTWADANGAVPANGATATATTSLGTLTAGTGGLSCTGTQACSGTVTAATQGVTLNGGGVPGTATVTFTTGSISVTKTVVLTGAVDTLTVKTQADQDGAGAGTAFVDAATPNAATFAAGFRVNTVPKDSAGNQIGAFTPTTVTVAPSSCATVGSTVASTTTAGALTTLTAGTAAAGTVCTVTVTSGSGSTLKTGSATYTIGGAFSSTTSTLDIGAADAAPATSQTVTVTVKDSSGNLVGDAQQVTLVASAGAFVSTTGYTVNGVATFTYVAPGTAQSVGLTAVAGTLTASKNINIGAVVVPPPTAGEGTFDREIPSVGVNTAVWNGGTVAQLSAATAAAGGISVTVFINGQATVLIPGAPAFVNAAFNAAFPTGDVPAGTIVLVVK